MYNFETKFNNLILKLKCFKMGVGRLRQFYLLNEKLSEQKIAEKYLEDEYEINQYIAEPISRIITFLSNITLDNEGNIEQLRPKRKGNQIVGYSFEDEYVLPDSNRIIKYEIVKKIISQNHVYEIRFLSQDENSKRNCRILFTINLSKPYLIWTHGFTKFPTKNMNQIKASNELTDQLATLAELIHKNLEKNESNYIGEGDGKHEIR